MEVPQTRNLRKRSSIPIPTKIPIGSKAVRRPDTRPKLAAVENLQPATTKCEPGAMEKSQIKEITKGHYIKNDCKPTHNRTARINKRPTEIELLLPPLPPPPAEAKTRQRTSRVTTRGCKNTISTKSLNTSTTSNKTECKVSSSGEICKNTEIVCKETGLIDSKRRQRLRQFNTTTSEQTKNVDLHSLFPDCVTNLDSLPNLYDPDSKDVDDPQLCTEYIKDIYQHLLHAERQEVFKISKNVMKRQTKIEASHRRVLVDWLVQVHAKFSLLPDTLHICIDIIDRYLEQVNVPKEELQLVGITALFLASKYEEIYLPSIAEFAYIAADTYTPKQICKKEADILLKLHYQLGKPNPLTFLRRYSKLMGTTTQIHNLSKYFIEASYLLNECHTLLPSQCAVGALVLATKVITKQEDIAKLWGPIMQQYTWYSAEMSSIFMQELLKHIHHYYQLCRSSTRLSSIKEKYTNGYNSVAAFPRLYSSLESLAKSTT